MTPPWSSGADCAWKACASAASASTWSSSNTRCAAGKRFNRSFGVPPGLDSDGEPGDDGRCRSTAGLCLGFLLLILLDVLIHLVWKLQIAINVPAVRIIHVRQDREFLLRLPGKDAIAARRIVIAALHLPKERVCLLLAKVWVPGKPFDQLVGRNEVVGHHREHQASVMTNVLSGLQRIH